MNLIIFFMFLFPLFYPFSSAHAEELKNRHITLYGAVMADSALAEMAILKAEMDWNYGFTAIAVGEKIGNLYNKIDFELEGQIVRHLVGQHLWEFNTLLVARWLHFPWNNGVKTSFAVGEGLSYASKTPPFEEKGHEKTNIILNYLMFEFAFALPQSPRWSLVTRIHHRSGIYGLFNGVHGGSNGVGLGIRYHF